MSCELSSAVCPLYTFTESSSTAAQVLNLIELPPFQRRSSKTSAMDSQIWTQVLNRTIQGWSLIATSSIVVCADIQTPAHSEHVNMTMLSLDCFTHSCKMVAHAPACSLSEAALHSHDPPGLCALLCY